MKIVIDNRIPYIKGVLEPYAEVICVSASEITRQDVANADVLIVRTRTRCDKALLEGTRIGMIASATIGFDHIDMEYCRAAGIKVVSAAGSNARGVLQWMGAALVYAARTGGWEPPQKTLGVVGVGHVGTLVAEYARSWGFEVLCCDPPRARGEGNAEGEGGARCGAETGERAEVGECAEFGTKSKDAAQAKTTGEHEGAAQSGMEVGAEIYAEFGAKSKDAAQAQGGAEAKDTADAKTTGEYEGAAQSGMEVGAEIYAESGAKSKDAADAKTTAEHERAAQAQVGAEAKDTADAKTTGEHEGVAQSGMEMYVEIYAESGAKSKDAADAKTTGEHEGAAQAQGGAEAKGAAATAGFVGFDEITRRCDIITFHTPLTDTGPDATYHMADAAFFASIRPGTLIINTSRGEVIDSEAILAAAVAGRCACCIDTWENEPDIDRALLANSLLATPHIAGYSAQGKANATAAVVRAVAHEYSLPPDDWYPENVQKTEPRQISWKTLQATTAEYFDIDAQSRALKARPECFEEFRNTYIYREEYF